MIRRATWAVALLAVVSVSRPARAGGLEISGGVAYWTENSSAMSVTLGKFFDLPGFQLGARAGFAYVTQPDSAGIPADVVAIVGLGTFYLEGQVGAWFLFTRAPTVRFHATGGGGLDLGIVRLGVEGGYLNNGALLGGRVSIAF